MAVRGKGWYSGDFHSDEVLRGVVDAVNSIQDKAGREQVILKLREHLPQFGWFTNPTGYLSVEA